MQLTEGTYYISSPINVSIAKGFTLAGTGYGTVLYANNGLNDYVIKYPTADGFDIWAYFQDFKIDGNNGNQTAGGGIFAKGALESVFTRIWIYKPYDWGIYFSETDSSPLTYGHHNKVVECHFDEGQQSAGIGQGVYITRNDENTILDCDFQYMGGTSSSTTGAIHDVSSGLNNIIDCIFVSCQEAIRFQDSSRSKVQGCTFDLVEDNNVVLKGEEILVIGNHFYQASANNVGNASPIYIDYYGHNTIVGNNIASHETNGTTKNFISDNGDASVGGYNLIEGNYFYLKGTLAGSKYDNINGDTNNIIRNNFGLITENAGTGTITSGNTSVTVSHGLDFTPVAADIQVTMTNNPTADPGNVYVDTITSTQFNINVRTDPSTSGAIFSWAARKVIV